MKVFCIVTKILCTCPSFSNPQPVTRLAIRTSNWPKHGSTSVIHGFSKSPLFFILLIARAHNKKRMCIGRWLMF